MESLWKDLRYGVRGLLKRRGLSAIVVISLALGIGANSAIFSVINVVLLRPLPYTEPDRLVMLWGEDPNTGRRNYPLSPADFMDIQALSHLFAGVAPSRDAIYNLTEQGEPEQILSYRFSADFFRVLGLQPQLGRTFSPAEDTPGGPRVVLLGDRIWRRRFGADPSIVGRSLHLSGDSYQVIGVMPATFEHPRGAELWTPLALNPATLTNRELRSLRLVARLQPGVTLDQTQRELDALSRRWQQEFPKSHAGWHIRVVSIRDQYVGEIKPALLVLFLAVVLVLLIACANVANLLLARGTMRTTETAIRAALGATRGRLIRQFLTESVLLSLLGGILSLPLALLGSKLLLGLFPNNISNLSIPRVEDISLDGTVFGFTLLISFLCGIGFGVLPAWQASRPDLDQALKQGRSGNVRTTQTGVRLLNPRDLFVIAQVALATLLLLGTGLMVKSFLRLRAVDLGFNPIHVLTARLNFSMDRKYAPEAERIRFYQEVQQRLSGLPGIVSLGTTNHLPLSGWTAIRPFTIEGQLPPATGERLETEFHIVSPTFFQTLGIPLLKGRAFTAADTAETAPVIIINEHLARRFFPNQDPLGKHLKFAPGSTANNLGAREIIGVIGDIRHESQEAPTKPEAYAVFLQEPSQTICLAVRTQGAPMNLAPTLRQKIWEIDPNLPISSVMSLEQLSAESVSRRRISVMLLTLYAGLAFVLAVVGIYGVLTNAVGQRTKELGIRMALGAEPMDLLRMVISEGMNLVVIGLGVGLLGAILLTRLMAHLLFGISATDPVVFLLVTAGLLLVSLLACYLPARHATRIDPLQALRQE